jgi:lysophospholipase L1-like esterase
MSPIAASIDSNYSRTQSENKDSIGVACIGDSITELSGYPNHLKMRLGERYIVGNFGACGTTVSLDSENSYLRSRAYALAKDFQPDIAIVMLGTNDANPGLNGSRFVADYVLLLDAIKHYGGKPRIWVVKPPHVFDESWLSGRIMSSEVIPSIEKVTEQTNLPLIDVYSATDNPGLFFDGVHPNEEGARIIADLVYQAILYEGKVA